MSATTTSVSFSVAGEHLTDRARDLVLSDEYEQAEYFLMESLHGMSPVIACQILSGEKRLSGISNSAEGICLEEDPDSADYQEEVAYIYEGRQRLQNHGAYSWWRPVAYWRWGPKALRACNLDMDTSRFSSGRQVQPEIRTHYRLWVEHNGGPGEIVRSISWDEEISKEIEGALISGAVLVYFEPCDAPPPWLKSKARRQSLASSFCDALKTGRVQPRQWKYESTSLAMGHEHPNGIVGTPERRLSQVNPPILAPPALSIEEEDEWPIWDGTGAAPAPPPRIIGVDEAMATLLDQEVSEERIAHATEQIRCQADDSGWMEFPWGDQTLKVPKGAFECWALRRTLDREDATPWKVISGEAWKQLGDDPYHTDWMLGAGLDLSVWQTDETLQEAAYDALQALQHRNISELPDDEIEEDYDTHKAAILVAPMTTVVGQVWHGLPECGPPENLRIAVIPNLGPQYTEALEASLVISEAGGKLAHLSQIGRERGVPILRLAKACEKLPEGTWIRVEVGSGIIEVIEAEDARLGDEILENTDG